LPTPKLSLSPKLEETASSPALVLAAFRVRFSLFSFLRSRVCSSLQQLILIPLRLPPFPTDFTESLLKAYPSLPNIPTGQPGAAAESDKKSQVFNGSKATKVLGLQYHTMDQTVKAMYDSIKANSFL